MTLTADQLEEAKRTLAAAAQANGNGAGSAPAGWTMPAPIAANPWAAPAVAAAPGPEKVLVPIKVPTPNGGSLRVYLQFPGEMAANPQTLMGALGQLAQMLPLDVYTPKNNWGGNGGGYRNGGGGGWNGGGRGGW